MWIETNFYDPYSSATKEGLTGNSNPDLRDTDAALENKVHTFAPPCNISPCVYSICM